MTRTVKNQSVPRTQWLLAWLPIAVVFAVITASHGGSLREVSVVALRMVTCTALLGVGVHRFTARRPWPHPLRWSFFALHTAAALLYGLAWFALNSLLDSVVYSIMHGVVAVVMSGPGFGPTTAFGCMLYVLIAGVLYAQHAAARTAQLEALAARTQLATLRAQLHPHLLFNALHTVVQLIPLDPPRAVRAAEELADMLRTALTEQRDVVPLAQEWAFVQRYLAIESLRLGERIRLHVDIDSPALNALVPSYALQTLVENAVRHGVAPRTQATTLQIRAQCDGELLTLHVNDDGVGADTNMTGSAGTGLRRLRERLAWLCGTAAQLELVTAPGQGFHATLTLPQAPLRAIAQVDGEDGDD